MHNEPQAPPKWSTILLWVLLIAAFAEFLVRGPIRYFLTPTYWNDLSQNYGTSRLWLRGQNISDPQNFIALWRDELSSPVALTARTRLAPMPGSVVLLAPIAWLPFPVALKIWPFVLLAAVAATLWALMRTANLHFPEPPSVAFLAFSLALAPFHTGIVTGNQTILILGFCALGILSASSRHDLSAGIWFGLACSLKPHIGSFLVLFYLLRFRWRLFLSAIATTSAITFVAVAWLQIRGVNWLHDYLSNLRGFSTHNTIDDFTDANPIRFLLVNLQVPFYSFTENARSANFLAFSVGAALIAAFIYFCLHNRLNDQPLLALGTIAVISLLPLYHRLYDATLLTIPLAWCFAHPPAYLRPHARLALIPIVPFLIPGSALLDTLMRHSRIPVSWTNSWIWNRFVMPHQSWSLLILSLLLLGALAKKNPGEHPPGTAELQTEK